MGGVAMDQNILSETDRSELIPARGVLDRSIGKRVKFALVEHDSSQPNNFQRTFVHR